MALTADEEFSTAQYNMTMGDEVEGVYEVTATGAATAFGFESITSDYGTKAYKEGTDYVVRYFVDKGNNGFDSSDTIFGSSGVYAPIEVGHYFAVAMTINAHDVWKYAHWNVDSLVDADGNLAAGVICVPFDIVPQSLEGVQAYNPATGTDEFTYSAANQNVQFKLGDRVLDIADEYEVTVVDENNVEVLGGIGNVINAGDYTATIAGADGSVYEGASETVEFTVAPLDLDTAAIYAPDVKAEDASGYQSFAGPAVIQDLINTTKEVTASQPTYTDIDGVPHAKENAGSYIAWDETPTHGVYTFTVAAAADQTNVTGSATYNVYVVDELIKDFRYGDHLTKGDSDTDMIGGLPDLPDVFDLSKGEAYNGSTIVAVDVTTLIPQGAADGQVTVDPLTATETGVYDVVARINVPENCSVGGSVRDTFGVIAGTLDPKTADVVVTFNGANFDVTAANATYTQQYTGEAVTPAISVSCEGKALVAGTDYTVTYKNAQGQAVESMVDAGAYTVEIKLANGYTFSSDYVNLLNEDTLAFGVQITPRALSPLYVDQPDRDESYGWGILYTGSEIAPVVKGTYLRADAAVNAAGEYTDEDYETVTLDPSWYELHGLSYKAEGAETFSPVDEVLEAGEYMVNVVPTAACANYDWADNAQTVTFRVIAKSAFSDVAADAWYADEVNAAFQNGYVNGMGNNMFFPNVDMTRAQFAQVVYNMAGEPEWIVNQDGTYPTQFSDVAADAWYAQAVSWASEAGIVNGTSETTFDPEGKITREQIATMLYRYAGNGAAADASALADFVDGDEVSPWAEAAMAWAVEEGYMEGKGANDLQPQATATRAEVAALSVRVQPEMLPRS